MKLIYTIIVIFCFSLTAFAQKPIKKSVLTGEWTLKYIKGEYDMYSYDCEKKEFDMSDQFYFGLGEARSAVFEKEIKEDAEKTSFNLKENGNYEMSIGLNYTEKGTWKSEAIDTVKEDVDDDQFGVLIFSSESNSSNIFVEVNKQQLALIITMEDDSGTEKSYVFIKNFKGNAF